MFHTTYTSKIIPLSQSEAICASDVWRRQVATQQDGSRFVRGTRRVWLRPVWNQRVSDRTELRLATGIAWCRAIPVRFQLEVSEWSGHKTILALRPRRFRRIAMTQAYDQLVREALQAVAAELLEIHAKELPTHLRLLSDGEVERGLPWRPADLRTDATWQRVRHTSDGSVGVMTR
jgi:hypothetical protein